MNRDQLLRKVAMELSEWPRASQPHASPEGEYNKRLPWGWWWWWESGDDEWLVLRLYSLAINHQDWVEEQARLVNKPSWDDAPERAEWLAQDGDGAWFWYLSKPKSLNALWEGPAILGLPPIQGALPAGHDWRATLEKRPAAKAHTEPEWVEGDWPPPINTACEYRDAPNSEWGQGVCVGYYNNYAVVVDEGIGGVSVQIVEHVRPLLTPEQKAVDKIHAVIMALPDDTDTRVAAQDIYNAIRRGDVPGVGLTGEAA